MASAPTSLADLTVLAAFQDGGFTIVRLSGVETPRMTAPPRAVELGGGSSTTVLNVFRVADPGGARSPRASPRDR